MACFGIDKKVGPFFKGAGCDTCAGSGYKGRQGLTTDGPVEVRAPRHPSKGGSTRGAARDRRPGSMLNPAGWTHGQGQEGCHNAGRSHQGNRAAKETRAMPITFEPARRR